MKHVYSKSPKHRLLVRLTEAAGAGEITKQGTIVSVLDSSRNLLITGIVNNVESNRAWNGVISINRFVLYKLYIKWNSLIRHSG